MAGIDWDQVGGNSQTYPSVNSNLKKKGDKVEIEFIDDGNKVDKDVIKAAREKKGIKSKVPPSDSYVFTVKDLNSKETKSFWMKTTQYTNLKELAEIREGNNDTLVGAKAKIEKVQSGDPSRPSLKIEPLK